MKEGIKIGLIDLLAHICASIGLAATGTSAEFRVDLSGMGPWEMRTARASEAISYSSAWATNAMSGANAVVKVWPVKREKPKYIAIDLSGGTTATHYPIEYLDEIPGGTWSDEYKTSRLVLRHIPAGSFIMGGRATDYSGASNTNLHMVTLTKDFYMGVFEVTQRQWELVMGNRPSYYTNAVYYAKRPVERVSYIDIRGNAKGLLWPSSKDVDDCSFLGLLRRRCGISGFDLPTEAQWEYACRAGTTTSYNNGSSSVGNLSQIAYYKDVWNSRDFPAVVGMREPNAWGLYDMHGNACEWVLDWYGAIDTSEASDPKGSSTGSKRICRGGWYYSEASACTSDSRISVAVDVGTYYAPDYTHDACGQGFRLCLTLAN